MKKQNITLSLAALVFGAALASAPAFAQQAQTSAPSYGRVANDGGTVVTPQQTGTRPIYDSASQQPKPSTNTSYGRTANDGGMVNPAGGR